MTCTGRFSASAHFTYMRISISAQSWESVPPTQQVLALNPEYPQARLNIVLNYLRQDNPERALAELDKIPVSPRYQSIKATVLFTLGEEMESQAITNKFLETSAQNYPLLMAIVYAWRGENDSAFAWLEAAFVQRTRELNNILWNNALSSLENDPRYPVFLEKLGLLEFWEAMPKPDEKL